MSESDLSGIDIRKLITLAEENDSMVEEALTPELYEFEDNDEAVVIDRHQENKDVTKFQETGDLNVIEEVYKNRIPTLKNWVSKEYYPGLMESEEDLFEELSIVFIKAVETYNIKKGAFNSWLWKLLENRLKNIKSSKHAKKRVSEHYDGPLSGMVLSLDYSYSDSDGTEITLKDIIPKNPDDRTGKDVIVDTVMDETIDILSKGDPVFKDALIKIGEGNSVASLVKAYKTKQGYVVVTPAQATKFRKNRCTKLVSELLEEKKIGGGIGGDFKLVDYNVVGTRLYYTVEMKKSPEADLIMKTIRDLRKNKEYYMKQIKGKQHA